MKHVDNRDSDRHKHDGELSALRPRRVKATVLNGVEVV